MRYILSLIAWSFFIPTVAMTYQPPFEDAIRNGWVAFYMISSLMTMAALSIFLHIFWKENEQNKRRVYELNDACKTLTEDLRHCEELTGQWARK